MVGQLTSGGDSGGANPGGGRRRGVVGLGGLLDRHRVDVAVRKLGYDGGAGELHDIIGFCQQLWPHATNADKATHEDRG